MENIKYEQSTVSTLKHLARKVYEDTLHLEKLS